MSEEQIIDIFSRVGTVVSFRLVHDKETGRPKGFGFLEFADQDNASAAVRNLNDFDIMGRKLRVDWSNESGSGGGNGNDGPQNQGGTGYDAPAPTGLPPLPAGTETPPGLSAPDAISQTLSAMQAPQLLDVISQMKGMVTDNPAQVTQLFTVAPQLAYAIFQALLLLGLVDTNVLSSIVAPAAQTAQYPPQPPAQQYPPQPTYPPYGAPAQIATPPVQQPAYHPPAPVAPPAQPDQQALIQQVLAMTPQQIYALDPASRDQIMQIRAQLGAPVG